jgi:hypothetical protein
MHRGTHPRTPCLENFPYTFGHPQDVRNIEDSGPSIARFSERGTKGMKGYICAMAYRDFKGSVVLMSTNHKSFGYPVVHRSYQEFYEEQGSMTGNNIEDTIEGALFSSCDDNDSCYEITHSATNSDSGNERDSDSEASGVDSSTTLADNISQTLGAIVSSQTSLVGDEYGEDSDTSSKLSVGHGVKMTTRLSRAASVTPLELGDGLSEDSDDLSEMSHNESSETDSDTSDDDVMYSNRQREEPTIDDGVRLKNSKPNEMPTYEALVSHHCYYAIGCKCVCDCKAMCLAL